MISHATEKLIITIQTAIRGREADKLAIRQRLSYRYIAGDGIEIGALHCPLEVGPQASVRYVDLVEKKENVNLFPSIDPQSFVEPDLIDDGETLSAIPDGSLDFIIANHFLEHTRNPIGTISVHLSKIKRSGVLYYAVPNKRYTFDQHRPITLFEHVLSDYLNPNPSMDDQHFHEYAKYVDGQDGDKAKLQAERLKHSDNRIHFHVWDRKSILELFSRARQYIRYAYRITAAAAVGNEVIVILRKQ